MNLRENYDRLVKARFGENVGNAASDREVVDAIKVLNFNPGYIEYHHVGPPMDEFQKIVIMSKGGRELATVHDEEGAKHVLNMAKKRGIEIRDSMRDVGDYYDEYDEDNHM